MFAYCYNACDLLEWGNADGDAMIGLCSQYSKYGISDGAASAAPGELVARAVVEYGNSYYWWYYYANQALPRTRK